MSSARKALIQDTVSNTPMGKPSPKGKPDRRGSIADLVDTATQTNRQSDRNDAYYDYATVKQDLAERIKEKTGIDVMGYVHSLDESSVRHILGEHGEGAELREDQEPVMKADFKKLQQVVEDPDSIAKGEKTRQGLDTIRFSRRFNGTMIVFEEVRTGKKKLVPKTMWKKKAPNTQAPE